MSRRIENISPDPTLTIINFLSSSNRVPVDLGEKFTLPLETFISESCTHATEHHYLYNSQNTAQKKDQNLVFENSNLLFSEFMVVECAVNY